ncbi:hypothetical protein PsorP6_004906 [Peronosclerospora sorghi]|uniref:Uncharacterized protein n=1 Tax=Peronosclerospora sorghi TaxID=230839 RepID=A0ACC0W2N0_9STRA|nr:hypothetical protein PsorP6_004906 [Peronosclerospora sorghi]
MLRIWGWLCPFHTYEALCPALKKRNDPKSYNVFGRQELRVFLDLAAFLNRQRAFTEFHKIALYCLMAHCKDHRHIKGQNNNIEVIYVVSLLSTPNPLC